MGVASFVRRPGPLVLVAVVASGCGERGMPVDDLREGAAPSPNPVDAQSACEEGQHKCDDDVLRVCRSGHWLRDKECLGGCIMPAGEAARCGPSDCDGRNSVCRAGELFDCRTGKTTSCAPGVCGDQRIDSICGAIDGPCKSAPDPLPCFDPGGTVSSRRACDYLEDRCVEVGPLDCGALTAPLQCVGGSYLATPCGDHLQPRVISCTERNASCSGSGPLLCTTHADGAPCGAATVCAKGWGACVQSGPNAARCEPDLVDCSGERDRVDCISGDAASACVDGYRVRWEGLRASGGSCDSARDKLTIGAGGLCIPGLVSCAPGSYCKPFAIGECSPIVVSAPPSCNLDSTHHLGDGCTYAWNNCSDGKRYELDCSRTGAPGRTLILCRCLRDGVSEHEFTDADVCTAPDLATLDRLTEAHCGWSLTTETAR